MINSPVLLSRKLEMWGRFLRLKINFFSQQTAFFISVATEKECTQIVADIISAVEDIQTGGTELLYMLRPYQEELLEKETE